MTEESIKKCRSECERFLDTLRDLEMEKAKHNHKVWLSNCPRETGAIRRASMDLTRALANMRKAGV